MTASTAPAIAPATYRIDPARSTVRFVSTAMFGLLRVGGTFTVREGTIVVADDVTHSSVTATVDASTIDTANTRRDNDLRANKYLDTARHPDILFTSREVTPDTVTGILRVHGTDQRVTPDRRAGAHARWLPVHDQRADRPVRVRCHRRQGPGLSPRR